MTSTGASSAAAMPARPQYSVLIAEDHVLFGESVRLGLEQTGLCKQIRLAKNGELALEAVAEEEPDLILMDVLMPEMDGITASQQIKRQYPHIKIIMLTSINDPKSIQQALSAGVDGYSSKEISLKHLAGVIHMVMHGAIWLDPDIARQVLTGLIQTNMQADTQEETRPSHPVSIPSIPVAKTAEAQQVLTARDIQILTLIADYKSNTDIASELSISEAWIDGYVRNIIEQLAVSNEVEAVRRAVDEGILTRARILEMY